MRAAGSMGADRGRRALGLAVLYVALALPLGSDAFHGSASLGFRAAVAGGKAATTCTPGSRRPLGHSLAAGLSMQSRRGGGRGGRGRGGGPAGAKKSGRMGKMVMQELMAIVRCVLNGPHSPKRKDPGPQRRLGVCTGQMHGTCGPLVVENAQFDVKRCSGVHCCCTCTLCTAVYFTLTHTRGRKADPPQHLHVA